MRIDEIAEDIQGYIQPEIAMAEMNDVQLYLPKNIRFECQKCGNCCIVNDIPLTKKDINRINAFLKKSKKLRFLYNKFYHEVENNLDISTGLSMKKSPADTKIGNTLFKEKCIFLSHFHNCLINPVKPAICKEYPIESLPVADWQHFENKFTYGFNFQNIPENDSRIYICHGFFPANLSEEEFTKLARPMLRIIFNTLNELISEPATQEIVRLTESKIEKMRNKICPVDNIPLNPDLSCPKCHTIFDDNFFSDYERVRKIFTPDSVNTE